MASNSVDASLRSGATHAAAQKTLNEYNSSPVGVLSENGKYSTLSA